MSLSQRIRVGIKRFAYGGIGGSDEGARVTAWLELAPGMKVADIGSGFGDFSLRFAREIGPGGTVFAVDTDADLRAEVAKRAREAGLDQLKTVAAHENDPALPEPVDVVFLSSSFHHLSDQTGYFQRLHTNLRPAARVVILEQKRGLLSGLGGHSTRPEEVTATLEAAGYRRIAIADFVSGKSLQAFVAAS